MYDTKQKEWERGLGQERRKQEKDRRASRAFRDHLSSSSPRACSRYRSRISNGSNVYFSKILCYRDKIISVQHEYSLNFFDVSIS